MKVNSRQLKRLGRYAAHQPLNIYCIGIGGTGVSGFARIAHQLGHSVSGSDRKNSKQTAALKELGITIFLDQSGQHLKPTTDLVVCSAAIKADHGEIVAAREHNIPVVKYSQALGAILNSREGLAVAGTHGKTTTSSLTAFVLQQCGFDPSFVIGGIIPQLSASAGLGQGPDMVVEACEFDQSFLALRPATAVILNIEEDHFDSFSDGLDGILTSFMKFAVQIKYGGSLVANADCENTLKVVDSVSKLRPDLKIKTFGVTNPDADFSACNLTTIDGRPRFDLVASGEAKGQVSLALPGKHNVYNALASIAASSRTGLDVVRAASVIGQFEGTKRRFTVLRDNQDGAVIDDYAHHPTAIRAVIEATRQRFPNKKVVAVFEPHQHNRVRRLFKDFSDSLATADEVFLTDIFRCRDKDEDVTAVSSADLAEAINKSGEIATHVGTHEAVLRALRPYSSTGDAVLFMGAGLISATAHRFVAGARSRSVSEPVRRDAVFRDSAACGASQRVSRTTLGLNTSTTDQVLDREFSEVLTRFESMAKHVTFKAGGQAQYFFQPQSLDQLGRIVKTLRQLGVPFHMLGGGSNTLFRDGVFEGAVIATRKLNRLTSSDAGMYAECGVLLQKLLHKAEKRGFAGLEELAGIPAQIGGAVFMNAGGGMNGPAVGHYIERVMVLEPDNSIKWLNASEINFGYRHSDLKGRIVMAAEFGGFKTDLPSEIRVRRLAAGRRKATIQPLSSKSAGCIFRNPESVGAGRLIDSLGLKGQTRGFASVSNHHANFIVNVNNANASDILDLIRDVQNAVEIRTGERLKLELQVK